MPDRVQLLLDLDGTLLDPRKRLFGLFDELVDQNPFTWQEYWKLKRQGVSQSALLQEYCGYDAKQAQGFSEIWHLQVEQPHRLHLDEPFPGVRETLAELKNSFQLILLTNRQSRPGVEIQLDRLGLSSSFNQVLVTEQSMSKRELVSCHLNVGGEDQLVGDTGDDIGAAKTLGIGSIAVLSGMLGEDALRRHQPDMILPSVSHLPKYLHTGLVEAVR